MLEGMHAAKDVSIRKTCRELRGNQKIPPHIEMYLSCTQCPLSLFLSLSLFISLCSSVSLRLSHIVAPLCSFAPSPFSYAARGPRWGPSLGSRTKQRRWCYQSAARRLSARIGPGWPSGRLADVCRCQAPSAFPLGGHLLRVWKSCGVCLWLHLNPPSLRLQPCLAEQTGSSARLACINCPCLARCLLLITLINFNSPGSRHHRSCFQTGTHTHTHTHTHECSDSFPHACMGRHECIFGMDAAFLYGVK